MLAHLQDSDLLDRYVLFRADISPELVEEIDPKVLPRNWRSYPAPRKVQSNGDAWAARGGKSVLRVPSAIVPAESNYLIHPAHPDFSRIAISGPMAFRFDARLAPRFGS